MALESRGQREPLRNEAELLGLLSRAFGLAVISHASLSDYDQTGWGWVKLIAYGVGIFCFFAPQRPPHPYRPSVRWIWGLVCLSFMMSKIYCLLMLRDVLTQSLLICVDAFILTMAFIEPRYTHHALKSISLITGATYGLAILHKLNHDFLFMKQSCAIHGIEVSLSLLPQSWLHESRETLMAYLYAQPLFASCLVIAIECSLCLLCIMNSRKVWWLGLIFHVPLALTIAPAFGSVMMIGWGAGTLSKAGERIRKSVRQRSSTLISLASLCYIVHGTVSPYLGIEVQHSAAMLSNLRIDPPCANSLVFPHLKFDPYIKVEEISFGSQHTVKLQTRAQLVKEGLWSLTALNVMKQNWCIPEHVPLSLRGQRGDQGFEIRDLCTESSLDELYRQRGAAPFRAWQRYQKNLKRQCHQACVH